MKILIAFLFAVIIASPAAAYPAASSQTQTPDLFCRSDKDPIERVAMAEAGSEGDSGLAAVVLVIRNRIRSGQWGSSIDSVLNAPGQFEPVNHTGQWRSLPAPSPEQRNHIDAIINLICEQRVPDFTSGALYFQNIEVVKARSNRGQVSPRLVGFGGEQPSAVVGRHSFYRRASFVGDPNPRRRPMAKGSARATWIVNAIFYGPEAIVTQKSISTAEQNRGQLER